MMNFRAAWAAFRGEDPYSWRQLRLALLEVQRQNRAILEEQVKLRSDLSVTFFNESHPKRQETSRALGNIVTERLLNEQKVRNSMSPCPQCGASGACEPPCPNHIKRLR